MSEHLTEAQKHDAAYGFAPAGHCDDCERAVEALRAEREALRRMLAAEAPGADALKARLRGAARRSRAGFGWWMLLPAAAVLAAMARLLFIVEAPRTAPPQVVPAQDSGEWIAKLVRDLSGPSPLRREVARAALLACDLATLEALDAAKTPEARALADEIRWPDPQARKLKDVYYVRKFTVEPQSGRMEDHAARLRDATGMNILIDAQVRKAVDLGMNYEFSCKDETLEAALKKLLGPLDMVAEFTEEGVVLLTTADERDHRNTWPERHTRHPLRISAAVPPEIDRWVADLGVEPKRDAAERALLAAGLAAEGKLWAALDHEEPAVASRAAQVLRKMYTLPPELSSRPHDWRRRLIVPNRTPGLNDRISLAATNAPLSEVLDEVRERTGLQFISALDLDAETISIKVTDIIAAGALKLALTPRQKDYWEVDGFIYIGEQRSVARTRPPETPLFWMEANDAREQARLLSGAAKDDRACIAALRDLEPGVAVTLLHYASRIMPAEGAGRCGRLADQIVAERSRQVWFPDEPTALERQMGLTGEQEAVRRTVREKVVELDLKGATLGEVLTRLTQQTGVDLVAQDPTPKVTIKLKGVTLLTALRFLAGPRGLGIQFSGKQLVLK